MSIHNVQIYPYRRKKKKKGEVLYTHYTLYCRQYSIIVLPLI